MTESTSSTVGDHWTRTSRTIHASAADLYDAFTTPVMIEWLPPGEMTGTLHHLDARVGGGYEMSLFYPESDTENRGKTGSHEDRIRVRFLELSPPRRIVEAISFATDDPALQGEMTQTITLDAVPGGTEVTLLFENIPAGIRAEDNDLGARHSLAQLARRFEADAS